MLRFGFQIRPPIVLLLGRSILSSVVYEPRVWTQPRRVLIIHHDALIMTLTPIWICLAGDG